MAADEEQQNARELRLSCQHEESQQCLRTLEAQKKTFLKTEEMFQARAVLDEERLEKGMLNVEGWTRIEVEVEMKETIRVKDEAIKSRDQKISKLKEDLAHEEKQQGQSRDYCRRVRGERDKHAVRIASLVATIDAQKAALAGAKEFKKSTGAHRLALEDKIRNLEGAVKFRDEASERMTIVRWTKSKELAESRAAAETSKLQP